jgi:lysophospholipase L1-like esterase
MNDDCGFTRERLEALGMTVPKVAFEAEIEKFRRADQKDPPEAGGIIFVGDSDVKFWRSENRFARHFEGLPLLNRGFGGARTWETLCYFGAVVGACRPRMIVYNAGDNDLLASEQVTPEKVCTGVQLFLDAVAEQLPETEQVLVLCLHPAPSRLPGGAEQNRTNKLLAELCNAREGVEFVDYNFLLFGADGELRPECFRPDGLHFTAEFYDQWAEFLRPIIEEHWGEIA